jgi:hypothetical protein
MRATRTATLLIPTVMCALIGLAPAPAAADDHPPRTSDYSHTPVLMIHGYFVIADAGNATWSNFRKRLVYDGWPDEYIKTPSFDNVRGCNATHVDEIDRWVEELRTSSGFDKIDIVCHSFGCLNTLSWLKERCGVNRVRQYVGLAGAVHGTWIACADDILGISCAGREMCIGTGPDGWKDNALIVEKNACDETPGDVQYTSVWSDYDEIIRPPSGSVMAGARNIEVETPWVEHGGIFLNDESYGHLETALTEGGLNEDGPSWGCTPSCEPVLPEPEPEPTPEVAPEPAPEPVPELVAEPAMDVPAIDPGLVPDRGADEVLATDIPTADVPATIPEDLPTPSPKSSGCTAGTPGPATGLGLGWLAMLAFCVVLRRRALRG